MPKLDDKELKAIFDEFDVNGDGHIQRAELRNVMQKMGQSPTDEELMAMFAAADADKDGSIDFEGISINISPSSITQNFAKSLLLIRLVCHCDKYLMRWTLMVMDTCLDQKCEQHLLNWDIN